MRRSIASNSGEWPNKADADNRRWALLVFREGLLLLIGFRSAVSDPPRWAAECSCLYPLLIDRFDSDVVSLITVHRASERAVCPLAFWQTTNLDLMAVLPRFYELGEADFHCIFSRHIWLRVAAQQLRATNSHYAVSFIGHFNLFEHFKIFGHLF
jgi:hypothetical protein